MTRKLTIELGRAKLPTWPHDYVPTRTITVEWADASGASWRARYLYVNGGKVAHIGITPNDGTKPELFGSVAGKEFRLPLPTVHWKHPCSPLRMAAYKVVRQFWHNMDGRYGWGSEYRRKAKDDK